MKMFIALFLCVIMAGAGSAACAADAAGASPDGTAAPVVPAWCAGGWSSSHPKIHDMWLTKTGVVVFLVGDDRDVVKGEITGISDNSKYITIGTDKFVILVENLNNNTINVTIMTKEGEIPLGEFNHAAPKDPGNIG
jgi:hypothetical protein